MNSFLALIKRILEAFQDPQLKPTVDVPSPRDIIDQKNIIYDKVNKRVIIKGIEGPVWIVTVRNSNSMDPVVDYGHTCILTGDFEVDDLAIGDVVVYEKLNTNTVIHRISRISHDSEGRYFTFKGDNNPIEDVLKVRDGQIAWLLLGVIY